MRRKHKRLPKSPSIRLNKRLLFLVVRKASRFMPPIMQQQIIDPMTRSTQLHGLPPILALNHSLLTPSSLFLLARPLLWLSQIRRPHHGAPSITLRTFPLQSPIVHNRQWLLPSLFRFPMTFRADLPPLRSDPHPIVCQLTSHPKRTRSGTMIGLAFRISLLVPPLRRMPIPPPPLLQ